MRNLTIQREKSFVASLGTMKVFLEDPLNPETTLNGIPCRMLGKLKNGEAQSFQIPENAARLLVTPDKLSASYSAACIQLPEGAEDLRYTGKNRFNPARGNAFRFDGVEEVPGFRKKNTLFGVLVLIAALTLGFVLGYHLTRGSLFGEKDKVFQKDDIEITLTDAFSETNEKGGFLYAFASRKAAVLINKESNAFVEDLSLEECAEAAVESAPGSETPEIRTEDGLTFIEYTTEVEGKRMTYFVPMYKNGDTFWVINFACNADQFEKLRPSFVKWASSVKFP